MRQQPLAMQSGFEKFARKSRRELFLDEMDKIVPWGSLVALVGPHYRKGESGRARVGLERMLRLYFLQQWFNLSAPGLEDALCESVALRGFAGIDLGREPVPDETAVCNFRHLLEGHDLGRSTLKMVNEYLAACGIKIATGTTEFPTSLGSIFPQHCSDSIICLSNPRAPFDLLLDRGEFHLQLSCFS